MTNPRYFEYALMIERFGSFKRAALELNLSQPALSKGISALEQEYNVEIFNRESRPLVPTAAGKMVLEEAQRVLQGHRQLKNRILTLRGVVSHKFRIAWGPYASKMYASEFLSGFKEQFPRSELHFINASWKDLSRLLRNRQVDLYIGDISTPGLHEEFKVHPLPLDEVVFVCSPQHVFAKRSVLNPAEICSQPLTLCTPPPWAQKWLKSHMKDYDSRESPASIRGDDYRLIEEIVLENPNLGTMASRACFEKKIVQNNLVAIPIQNPPYLQAGIVVDPGMKELPLLNEVVELILALAEQKIRERQKSETVST